MKVKSHASSSGFILYMTLTMNNNHNVVLYLRPEWDMI